MAEAERGVDMNGEEVEEVGGDCELCGCGVESVVERARSCSCERREVWRSFEVERN